MRKQTLLILWLSLFLIGCGTIHQHWEYIKLCWGIDSCYQSAKEGAKNVGEKVGDLVSMSPIPAAGPIARSIATYLTLIILSDRFGKKKKDEQVKEQESSG